MKHWAIFGLTMLSACMGGSSSVVLSEPPELPDPLQDPPDPVDPGNLPLGHENFALLLNDERTGGGVMVVEENGLLSMAAQNHAADMVANEYLSHADLQGGHAGDRALAVGYDWDFIAENIARGFDSDAEVMAAWMASPGHRDNILDPRAEDFGIGLVNDTWVLLLGSEFPQP